MALPARVSRLKVHSGIAYRPAGIEIRERTPGTMRPKKMALCPCLSMKSTVLS